MPYTQPHYAVIRDGEVITRCESFALALQSFEYETQETGFLELTIQNVRGIKLLAQAVIDLSETKEIVV